MREVREGEGRRGSWYTGYHNAAVPPSSLHGAIRCVGQSKDMRLSFVHLSSSVIVHVLILIH